MYVSCCCWIGHNFAISNSNRNTESHRRIYISVRQTGHINYLNLNNDRIVSNNSGVSSQKVQTIIIHVIKLNCPSDIEPVCSIVNPKAFFDKSWVLKRETNPVATRWCCCELRERHYQLCLAK
jgi:hypothetical protein